MYTVVIATLGNINLIETINQINNGILKPEEILICIPKDYVNNIKNISCINNVKIVPTNVKGQVLQRIEGFKLVKTDYTIQLDDDIHVDENCFNILIEKLNYFGLYSAVSPTLFFKQSRKSCYSNNYFNSKLMRLLYSNNADVNGKISKTGAVFGIDLTLLNDEHIETEWLPGGCVAHHTKNLILDKFYPFDGKAYYEDVYHSILLRKKTIKLFICKNANCFIDDYENFSTNIFKSYFHEYKFKSHVLDMLNKTKIFLKIELVFLFFNFFYIKIKNCNK
jgi:hypothetical protein